MLLADAIARGAEVVLTTASAQSNFCRAFAAGAARLGLRCILLLRGDGQAPVEGNLLLDLLFGAEVHWIDTTDPYDPAVLARLQALAAERRRAARGSCSCRARPGRSLRLRPRASRSRSPSSAGRKPTSIWLAAGSGLTAAGLALGCEALGLPARVQVDLGAAAARLHRAADPAPGRGGGGAAGARRPARRRPARGRRRLARARAMGMPSRPALDAMVLAARLEGWTLDPVYAGKALAALIAAAEAGELAGERVVFVCSGGAPALFAHGAALARHLAEPA